MDRFFRFFSRVHRAVKPQQNGRDWCQFLTVYPIRLPTRYQTKETFIDLREFNLKRGRVLSPVERK